MTEVSPASDWAQRWNGRSHSWRHKSEGGFDSSLYEVAAIGTTEAKNYVVEHHYSASYPADSLNYGLFCGERLVGVMVLSVPAQKKVLTNVFPHLEPYEESLELGRLVLADSVPANGESWFLKHAFRLAAWNGLRGVVSFADPVPRRVSGRLLFPGHIGVIYQASNALYTGRATPRTLKVLPDGTVLNDRAMQKVRKQDKGHEYVEQKLRSLGARPLGAGEDPTEWMWESLRAIGLTRIKHAGNHRYAFALGRTRNERARVVIAGDRLQYPKSRDEEAA